jgi:hypothetical protein
LCVCRNNKEGLKNKKNKKNMEKQRTKEQDLETENLNPLSITFSK